MKKAYEIDETVTLESLVSEPKAVYSYADYLKWSFEERVELIKGKIFKMSPAPKRIHQEISMNLSTLIKTYLKGKSCKVFAAPFDVRLPNNISDPDSKTYTVVQPDICVVCNSNKLDDAGCNGAPDVIIEILSQSTAKKDLKNKYELYQEHKVEEYWIIFPDIRIVEIFVLKHDKYVSRGKFISDEIITSKVLNGFAINVKDLFEG